MLTKLIGYEMKAFGRIILPLYAATIGMSFLIGVGIRVMDESMYTNLVGAIAIMIFVTLIIATMVMTAVLCVQRFYHNLLGNEGYLMFSLPVGTHQLILSKVLGSLIWAVLGGVAGLCTVIVMELAAVPFQDTLSLFRQIGRYLRMHSLGVSLTGIFLWIVIAVLAFVAMLMHIYVAMAIGQLWTNHRILGSVLAYFGIDIVVNTIFGILSRIGVSAGLQGLFFSQTEEGIVNLTRVQAGMILTTLLMIVIYSAGTWFLLDRKLNLE